MDFKHNLKAALDWRNLRVIILFNTGITLLLSFIFLSTHGFKNLSTILITAIYAFCVGFSIYFMMSLIVFEVKSRLLGWIISVIQILTATMIGAFIANLFFMLIFGFRSFRIKFADLRSMLFMGLIFGLAGSFIFTYYHLSETRKLKNLELKKLKTEIELKSLISRINPHFFFNTLNSIASLIRIDPGKAESITQKLANLFRYTLRTGENQLVKLESELEMVGQYLEIEKVRFDTRLSFDFKIDPGSSSCLIPPLLLLTLVENSIKHGISPLPEGGRIEIRVSSADQYIDLSVIDNGVGFDPETDNQGFGLKAVARILELQYGRDHRIEIRDQQGTEVKMKLPLITEINTRT